MDLIIGGAYQGKLCYARAQYSLSEDEIETCTETAAPDLSKRCLRHLEAYVLGCIRRGEEPQLAYRPDAILICRDISGGVVPLTAEDRAWREAVGRMLNRLAGEAAHVTRLYCGLPQTLK